MTRTDPLSNNLRLAGIALLLEGIMASFFSGCIFLLLNLLASGNIMQRMMVGVLNQANIPMISFVLFVASLLILYGAIQMRKVRKYVIAVAGAALGFVIPLAMVCLFMPGGMVGLVEVAMVLSGLWAFCTLLSPNARAEFSAMGVRPR